MTMTTDIRKWIFRIVTWDGLLPAAIWLSPLAVQFLIPDRRGAVELTAVFLPVAAVVLRFHAGQKRIWLNHCRPGMQRLQLAALCLGIFLLMFIDAVMILSHIMPKGAAFAANSDRIIWAVFYLTYVFSMAVAMFPGRIQPASIPAERRF